MKTIVLKRHHCGLILFLLAVCLQAGCAARKPLTPPPEMQPPRLETLEDARELLLRTYGNANSLKASGKIQIKLFEEKHWRPASFVLMFERPDKVRLRAYRPLAPTLFELISNGRECWLFIPSEKTAYLSNDCEVPYRGNKHIAVSADAIVAAIVVVSDFDELFSLPMFSYSRPDDVRLVFVEETTARKELWINSKTGLATRQLLTGADGVPEADISYKEHAFLDNTTVPVEIEIGLPRIRASMLLRINNFRVDPEIPVGAFSFSPPRNTRILDPKSENPNSYPR